MNEINDKIEELKRLKTEVEDRIKFFNGMLIKHRRVLNEINRRQEVLKSIVDLDTTPLILPDYDLKNYKEEAFSNLVLPDEQYDQYDETDNDKYWR